MNFELPYIPERAKQPREHGITMMMDKGLSLREAENFVEANAHLTDIVNRHPGKFSAFPPDYWL